MSHSSCTGDSTQTPEKNLVSCPNVQHTETKTVFNGSQHGLRRIGLSAVSPSVHRCLAPETDVDETCSEEQLAAATTACEVINTEETLETCREVRHFHVLPKFMS